VAPDLSVDTDAPASPASGAPHIAG